MPKDYEISNYQFRMRRLEQKALDESINAFIKANEPFKTNRSLLEEFSQFHAERQSARFALQLKAAKRRILDDA